MSCHVMTCYGMGDLTCAHRSCDICHIRHMMNTFITYDRWHMAHDVWYVLRAAARYVRSVLHEVSCVVPLCTMIAWHDLICHAMPRDTILHDMLASVASCHITLRRVDLSFLLHHIAAYIYTRLVSNSAPTWSSKCCFTACHFWFGKSLGRNAIRIEPN